MVWEETIVTSRDSALDIMVTRKSVFWKYTKCFLVKNVCEVFIDCVVIPFDVFGVAYRCYVGWQEYRQGAKVSSGKRGGFGGWERDSRGEPLRPVAEAPRGGKRHSLSLISGFTWIYLGRSTRQRPSSADSQG